MSLIDRFKAEIRQLEESRRLRCVDVATRPRPGTVSIRGREFIDFTSWDIYGFAGNTRVQAATRRVFDSDGAGSSASRASTGSTAQHVVCEEQLARFLGVESSLLLSSLNQAVLTLFSAILEQHDVIIIDELLQSPVIDAALLAHAPTLTFRSDQPETLERVLGSTSTLGERVVVSEGLSPITGMLSDLRKIAQICTAAGAHLIVDESTALGMVGERGAGACEYFRLAGQVFCRFGDLSRTLHSYGGFVAGSALVCGYLLQRSRSISVDPALPALFAAAASSAIEAIELAHLDRRMCIARAERLHSTVRALGLGTTAVVPAAPLLMIRSNDSRELHYALAERGFLTELLIPSLPRESSSVRAIFSAQHSDANIEMFQNALTAVARRVAAI